MSFDWDNTKARNNLEKHGLSFEDAVKVFSDDFLYQIQDIRKEYGEERIIAFGAVKLLTKETLVIAVVYTIRLDKTRIISARKAHRKERSIYEKNKKTIIRLRTA